MTGMRPFEELKLSNNLGTLLNAASPSFGSSRLVISQNETPRADATYANTAIGLLGLSWLQTTLVDGCIGGGRRKPLNEPLGRLWIL
jgi:hypothetical protein